MSGSVAVVGLGYVGSCLAVTMARRGWNVVGIDRDPAVVDEIASGRCRIPEPGLAELVHRLAGTGRLAATTDFDAVRAVDVIVITVGTPVGPDGRMVDAQLAAACRQLAGRLRRGQLIILKSTVSPGTTRGLVAPLLEAGGMVHEVDFGLAYCPERLAEGEALAQVCQLPVVVGGCSPASSRAAAEFCAEALGVPVQVVPQPETAEMIKLATNWWIDANIAIANELARVCAAFHVDVLDVIDRANELPKGSGHVNILTPGVGVGGPCLTKDPWMAWRAAQDRGVNLQTIATARRVNDRMPAFAAELITGELAALDRDPASSVVAVLGLAFKNNTGDLRNTPVKAAVDALRRAGATVRLFDPLADPLDVVQQFADKPADTVEDAVTGADCLAVLAGHNQFRDLDFRQLREHVAMPCLVFDGRMSYPPPIIRLLGELGYRYRGLGR
jgi:dTDP-alpha-D-glucose dehydrogenase